MSEWQPVGPATETQPQGDRRCVRMHTPFFETQPLPDKSNSGQHTAVLTDIGTPFFSATCSMRAYSVDLRCLAIRKFLSGWSLRKTAAALEIGKSTVHRWLLDSSFSRPVVRARKATQDVCECVRSVLLVNAHATCTSILRHIKAALNVNVSRATVHRCIKKLRYTRKRTHAVAPQTTLLPVRAAFSQAALNVPAEAILSVDETSFWVDMQPTYGYALRGQRLIRERSVKDCRKRITVIMAVSSSGVRHWKAFSGSVDATRFLDFMSGIDYTGITHVVLDNVRFHHSQIVTAFGQRAGVKYLYTPAYSPDYNPIENVSGALKTHYRSLDFDASMADRVREAIGRLDPSVFENTFRHWQDVMRRTIAMT